MKLRGVILAAGKGSRLYPVTHHIAKPLLPIANKPTLHYAIENLKEMGIDEVCLVVGENEQQMRTALGDGSQLGVKLDYVRQTEPQGLAHAVGFAKDFVKDDPFCLYLGDAMYSESLAPFAQSFLSGDSANLNLVKWVEDPSRYGVATLDGDRIVKLVEKPKNPDTNWAMAGLYFFRKALWDVLPDLQPSGRGEYEITDAIQMLIDRGETVLAGKFEGDWFDTGTLDSFLETNAALLKGSVLNEGEVTGAIGKSVVIGPGANVVCESIEDSVVLPGAQVRVSGPIKHSLLGGTVDSNEAVEGQIVFNPPQP